MYLLMYLLYLLLYLLMYLQEPMIIERRHNVILSDMIYCPISDKRQNGSAT